MKPAVDKKQATYTIDFIGSSSQAMRFGTPEPPKAAPQPAKPAESEIKAPAPPPPPKPAQPAYNAQAQVAKTPPKTPPKPAPKVEPAKPAEPPKEAPAPPAEEKVVLNKPSILGDVDSSNIDPSAMHSLEGGDEGSGAVRASFTNFPYPWYISLVRNALWKEWSKRMPKKAGLSTLVSFTIDRNGAIYSVHIEKSSGNDSYDYAATSAANNSAPFPPLPKDFGKDILTVTVEFKNVD